MIPLSQFTSISFTVLSPQPAMRRQKSHERRPLALRFPITYIQNNNCSLIFKTIKTNQEEELIQLCNCDHLTAPIPYI